MGAFLRELVFRVMYTLFPGGGLTLAEWEQFGTSMVWCTLLAALIGWIVLIVYARFQLVNRVGTVWRLKMPYRWGIGSIWILVILWTVIYVPVMFGSVGKASAFFHPNTFVLLVISGLMSWAIYAVLASLACRWISMNRYRYVTLINRLVTRRS
jgi:hypothetical protein